MKHISLAIVLLGITASCMDRHGVMEASFRLRDDSPLPSWFILPSGMSRDQVSVTITEYAEYEATITPEWKMRFVIQDNRHWFFNTIQEQMGIGYWHPDSLRQNPPGGTYPHWIIIEVNGTKEVYEQSEANDLLTIVKK
jgi:hypothetical protein